MTRTFPLLLCVLLTGCSASWFAHPLGGKVATPEQTVELPRQSIIDPGDVEVGNMPSTWPTGPVEKTWTNTWTIAASSITNHPARFTGICETTIFGELTRELTVQPVNYYTLLANRTNSFGQVYQVWKPVTNDLEFYAVVMTTNRFGGIGAFTR